MTESFIFQCVWCRNATVLSLLSGPYMWHSNLCDAQILGCFLLLLLFFKFNCFIFYYFSMLWFQYHDLPVINFEGIFFQTKFVIVFYFIFPVYCLLRNQIKIILTLGLNRADSCFEWISHNWRNTAWIQRPKCSPLTHNRNVHFFLN